jgi:hypothetical protein
MAFRIRQGERYVSAEARTVTRYSGGNGDAFETPAPGGRIVTAGDGNMVTLDHMGHPRQALKGATSTTDAGSNIRSRRRGRKNVRTYPRGRAVAYAG